MQKRMQKHMRKMQNVIRDAHGSMLMLYDTYVHKRNNLRQMLSLPSTSATIKQVYASNLHQTGTKSEPILWNPSLAGARNDYFPFYELTRVGYQHFQAQEYFHPPNNRQSDCVDLHTSLSTQQSNTNRKENVLLPLLSFLRKPHYKEFLRKLHEHTTNNGRLQVVLDKQNQHSPQTETNSCCKRSRASSLACNKSLLEENLPWWVDVPQWVNQF